MGGEDSARIHSGAETGELVTCEGLAWPTYAALGSSKRKRGSRKIGPTKERVGPICLYFLFTCIFNDQTHRSFVVFSDF